MPARPPIINDTESVHRTDTASLQQRIQELEGQLASHNVIATRLQLQYQVADILAGSETVAHALPQVLQTIATIKGWNIALAWVSVKHTLDHAFEWCQHSADTRFLGQHPALFDPTQPGSLQQRAMENRELIWLDQCTSLEDMPEITTASGIQLRNIVVAPLVCADQCYGVIMLVRDRCRVFNEDFRAMYRALGNDVGRFIQTRRYQLELQQSNARLSQVQRIGKIGYWEWNIATGRVFANDGAAAALQRPRNQLPRTLADYLALVPDTERGMVQALLEKARANPGETQHFEHPLLSSNKQVQIVRVHCQGQADQHGQVVRVSGSVQNITEQRRAEQRLLANEKLWEFVFRSSPVPGVITDNLTGELLAANEEFLKWVGLSAGAVIGRTTVDIGLWNSHPEREAVIGLARTWGRLRNHEIQHRIQGELRTVLINIEHIELDGRACLFTKYIDISDRKKLESALLHAGTAIEQAAEAIVLLDRNGYIIKANPAFTAITGYALDEAQDQPFDELLNSPSGRHIKGLFGALTHNLRPDTPWKGELWARRKDTTIFPQLISISAIQENQGGTGSYVVVFSDHSDRKRYEDDLKHLAMHDGLTGLPNRALLQEHLEHAVALGLRQRSNLAVLYTDLDLFKQVNDEHGHDTGDELLRQVAARLRVSVRDSDLVARLGGDEFVIVLQGLSSPHDTHRIASNIIRHMAEPFYVNGVVLRIGISVGIALFPQHAATTAELLRRADQALYHAKDKGRGAYVFWAHPPLADDHSTVIEAGG